MSAVDAATVDELMNLDVFVPALLPHLSLVKCGKCLQEDSWIFPGRGILRVKLS